MNISILNCEEEPIHLCGQIQNFGYLIVFAFSGKSIALSENCSDWLLANSQEFLHKDLSYFLKLIGYNSAINIGSLLHNPVSFTTILNNRNFDVVIYLNNDLVFLEFELQSEENHDITKLIDFQNQLDQSQDVWEELCHNIYDIIGFDRIMIYQFQEDSSGIVIAEHTKDGLESLLGYRYPDFDIPSQARKLYEKNLSRQTADINSRRIPIIGSTSTEIDLSKSQIRALSPIHLKYLENFGVQASASFSIIINNKLWGLVACQNLQAKHVPLDGRNLCLFLINYTVNRYLVQEQEQIIEYNYRALNIELELKEKLFYNHSLEYALSDFADQFMSILNSDGMIIKTQDTILKFGETPSEKEFRSLHAEVNQRLNKMAVDEPNIYFAHDFEFVNSSNKENNDFPGIARINIGKDINCGIYWFRKEIFIEEKWAGIPKKNQEYSKELNAYIYSPRNSFEAWMKEVNGQSEKWTDCEQDFLKRIQKIVFDFVVYKIEETKKLNQKLVESNNKLETFSHQLGHDIKNFLTVIKSSSQLLQLQYQDTLIMKSTSNILEAIDLIDSVIDKTIDSIKQNSDLLAYEKVYTDGFINEIIDQALDVYQINRHEVTVGKLFPLYGDKTLLYQLFLNLINNAIKFSSKQDMCCLDIYSEAIDNTIVYCIKDNGIGIKEEEKYKIFNIFQRLSNAHDFEGTGVGMSIVKRIIEKLNAKIEVYSVLGEGTSFKIIFPTY